jgi:hypothetical protein
MVSIILNFLSSSILIYGVYYLNLKFWFSLSALVPFLACLCAFPCLPLCLSLPAFAPFLACICAFPCLTLCLFLTAFVHLCNCFQEVCINHIGVRSIPELTNGTRLIFFLVHYSQFYPNTMLLLVHGFSPYDENSYLKDFRNMNHQS